MPSIKGSAIICADRKAWCAHADAGKQELTTKGYLCLVGWNSRVLMLRSAGSLEQWQEDYLAAHGYPLDKAENNRWKTVSRKAVVAKNIAIVTAEASNLRPSQIKKICGGYKKKPCGYEGGCTRVSVKRGLCLQHQGAVASTVAPQTNNLMQPVEMAQAKNDIKEDVVFDENVVLRFHPTSSDFRLPDSFEWSEFSAEWGAF
jgi:hypothetical protein